jgi:Ca2+-transporting ATPase
MCPLECRSETGTVLTTASFDSKQMNWAMLGEFVLAVLVTQMDVFQRLLGIAQLNLRQFAWALLPAIALLVLWELGKLLARRSQAGPGSPPDHQGNLARGAAAGSDSGTLELARCWRMDNQVRVSRQSGR